MKNRDETLETRKDKDAKRPYRRPEVHSEDVTERQGLGTCAPSPSQEEVCTPV